MIRPHPPSSPRPDGVPELLDRWQQGCPDSGKVVLAMVHGELRALAAAYLGHERANHTLQPTALVHEAFLRMVRGRAPGVASRRELVAIAARVMRQVLVNHAAAHKSLRRGGGRPRIPLDAAATLFEDRCFDLVDLGDALDRLHEVDPRLTAVVELRFFGGMTMEETARLLGTPLRTVERDWALARAWLRKEIAP